MMPAVDVDIADAVTSALADGDFSLPIEPVRSYAEWDEALEDFHTLHVDVVPIQTSPSVTLDDRGSLEFECEIDIGVRYRFGEPEQENYSGRIDIEEIDKLKLLLQEIAEFFAVDRLSDPALAIWNDTTVKLSWSRKHLRQMRQFFGFIRLTFLAQRDLSSRIPVPHPQA